MSEQENENKVLQSDSSVNVENDSVDYVEAIKQLKSNSVSKDSYEKLKGENKKLMDALIQNKQIEEVKPKKEIDVKSIEKKLAERDPRLKSIEGFQMMLDLREADIAAGKIDPFISANLRTPTQADFDEAQRRADIYKECIDYAEGDPKIFSQELTRRMVDPNILPRPKNNSRR